jgi:hypothetical protein
MLLLVLAAVVAQAPMPLQWAQFGRTVELKHISETVDIATGDPKGTHQFQYRLRFTRRAPKAAIEIKWADSRSCPAVRSVIASMSHIAMPSPAPYGVPGEPTEVTVDGTDYFLTAPSSYNTGRVTITSNRDSPLSQWVDAALEQLAVCWKAAAP